MTEETSPREQRRMKDVPRNLQKYFLILLLKGERWDDTQGEESAHLLPQHLAYLRAQIEAGRYAVAGPVLQDKHLVGICIAHASSIEDAAAIASADPGVQARRLRFEVKPALLPSLEGLRIEF